MGLVENCHIPSMFSAYVGINRLLTFYLGKNLDLNNHKQNNLIKKVLIPGNGASQGLSYIFDVFCLCRDERLSKCYWKKLDLH